MSRNRKFERVERTYLGSLLTSDLYDDVFWIFREPIDKQVCRVAVDTVFWAFHNNPKLSIEVIKHVHKREAYEL